MLVQVTLSDMKKFLISITLTLSILLGSTPSFADVAGLVPCSQSASFSKRLDSSVKKLEARLKKYKSGTPAALAIEQKIATTKDRFDRYSKSELLCGKDGLPHLIADGRPNHAVEFVVPGILFIYITGWIGWVGRKYLRTVQSDAKLAAQKEIIIDVPIALRIMSSGFIWPLSAWEEFVSGDLVRDKDEVTTSPR